MKRKIILFIVCMMFLASFQVIAKAASTYSVVNAKTSSVYASYSTYASALSDYNSRKSSDTSTSYGIMKDSKLITCDNAVARFSSYFTCTETDTGRSNYFTGSLATDAAYLGTSSDGTKVYIMISGQRLTVSVDNLLTLEESSQTSVKSYYTNNGGYMKHYVYSYSSSPTTNSIIVGYSYSKFTDGIKYYSYDGHYFYTDYNTMLSDYRNNIYTHSINPSEPYYNYYEYLSHRTSTNITADQINSYIVKNIGSSSNSVMYNTGSAFITAGNTYTVNPALILGVAIYESGWGRSSNALNNNNLFGHGAYDNTASATVYSSVLEGLKYHAYNYLSAGYLDPSDSRYRGPHLGNKQSGINVCYASTTYWGEQVASYCYSLDNYAGGTDYGRYTIGVISGNISVYNSPSTSSTVLYRTGDYNGTAVNNSSVVILDTVTSGGVTFYKIASDAPLNSARTAIDGDGIYSSSRDYGYVKASDVRVVFSGKGNVSTTVSNYTPTGVVDAVICDQAGFVTVAGWAYDKDDVSKSLNIKVYIGSTCLGTISANLDRADVNAAYSITGAHGFSDSLYTSLSGSQTVTVKAVDPQTNVEYTIGSKTVTITASPYTNNYNPIGNVESITATAGCITIGGWAYDPDSASQSISVKAYIGSTCLGTVKTNVARSDVNSKFSISGNHGFGGKLSTTLTGTQTVTIKAVNLADNKEYTIGSKSVTIPSTTNNNPIGNVEAVTATANSITIAGWAYDPDSASQSISVKAYIGSTCLGTVNTTVARSDVNSKFSISGKHGFGGTLSTTLSGVQTVTIKAVDANTGSECTIGSKSVTIPSSYTTKYNPIGNVEAVTATAGSITIAGWAYDPDSASQSISVKAYIGSTCLGTLSTNVSRSDVNSKFSISGNHGFSGKLSTTLTGTQTVTIKAVNVGSGVEYTIGSKSVTIPTTTNNNPKGNVEAVTASAGSIAIGGWAYDPDSTSQSISVKAYIGSTCLGTLSTNVSRSDVNSAFSISGNHGFSGKLSTTLTGTQTVTIKAVDANTGSECTIGSKSVTIPSTTNNNPKGNVEAVTATAGSITIAGWAYDPDSTSQSISVKAYVGSTCLGTLNTNVARSDVNSAFSISGNHGFSGKLSTTLTGTQTVTIKAVDANTGSEYTIGSKSVTIPSSTTYTTKYAPQGSADVIQAQGSGQVYAGGWAFDKDSLGTNVTIKMYAGSTLIGAGTTSFTRSDVNTAYGITGTHGYNLTCTTALRGTYTITIKAVDLQTNTEYTIGSKSITIS